MIASTGPRERLPPTSDVPISSAAARCPAVSASRSSSPRSAGSSRPESAHQGSAPIAATSLAAAGLAALASAQTDPRVDAAIAAWRTPVARIRDGRTLHGVAHAAIDVSDGLARDLGHVAAASGVRAVLDAPLLLEHAGELLARAAEAVSRPALDLILFGGEDYALVAASAVPLPGFTRVGEVRRGAGLGLRTGAGEEELVPRGFDHFVSGP